MVASVLADAASPGGHLTNIADFASQIEASVSLTTPTLQSRRLCCALKHRVRCADRGPSYRSCVLSWHIAYLAGRSGELPLVVSKRTYRSLATIASPTPTNPRSVGPSARSAIVADVFVSYDQAQGMTAALLRLPACDQPVNVTARRGKLVSTTPSCHGIWAGANGCR